MPEPDPQTRPANTKPRAKHIKTAIERFLVSFFFIEVGGQTAVYLPIKLLKTANIAAPYDFVHSIPYHHHIVFTLLLLAAIGGNIAHILHRKPMQAQDFDKKTDAGSK
ncbi:MAG: hypothetical protein IJ139_07900 [Bacteroidaceae bacterium]|nr:hypothetical protein [Bacteroidaceae bacterium]MBQ8675428.1 hypothetical protein [Bacteroidaceae bacterium]MBQ9176776.1 hypothetical protein [Bacteroidaceae bacterium]